MFVDVEELRDWFFLEKRDFPWRNSPTSYRVWISEIMLQQTQAAVVVPYFEKWMEKFPTIESLASSSEEEVIKIWEGLGYYSRARNLYHAAKYLTQNCGGKLPDSHEELLNIKGIGPYTAGAILSFAFHQKAVAVDGNVARVISRLFSIEDEVAKPSTQKQLRKLAFDLLPNKEPWVIVEALIELGATVCMKRPLCDRCPLQSGCLGFQNGKADRLPNLGIKSKTIQLIRFVPVIQHEDAYLIQKGKEGKVMAGLYEFPYLEGKKKVLLPELEEVFGLKLSLNKKLEVVKHTFTCYRAHLYPSLFTATPVRAEVEGYSWFSKKQLQDLPFSSGHRRILHQI
jgi:A/G-specific adenine glycosylase